MRYKAMKHIPLISVLALSLLVFAGCSRADDSPDHQEEAPALLSVGMMSAVDAAPFYYAKQEGYFTDEGLEVELIMFTNAQNRQTALQTGAVDGAMTDLVALITQAAGDFSLTGTLSTDGVFPLLSSVSLFEKDRIRAGTMEISVTNYILEEYLFQSHHIEKIFINEIPARLEAVLSGQLDAGIFPEPFATIGELRGLDKITFPDIPRESLNLIAFTDEAIDRKGASISFFTRAYRRAVEDLQQQPDRARDILLEVIPNLPEEARDLIMLPEYQLPRLPSDAFINEIIQWTSSVTGMQYSIAPDDILDRSFVR